MPGRSGTPTIGILATSLSRATPLISIFSTSTNLLDFGARYIAVVMLERLLPVPQCTSLAISTERLCRHVGTAGWPARTSHQRRSHPASGRSEPGVDRRYKPHPHRCRSGTRSALSAAAIATALVSASATAQGGDIIISVNSLESCNNDNVALIQFILQIRSRVDLA